MACRGTPGLERGGTVYPASQVELTIRAEGPLGARGPFLHAGRGVNVAPRPVLYLSVSTLGAPAHLFQVFNPFIVAIQIFIVSLT